MIGDDDTVAYPSRPASGDSRVWLGSELVAGRYQLRGWLGSGGMGTVYRADDAELGEVVALKVLRAELVGDPAALERFRREVKLARRIAHRNVARMFDIGEHAGSKFLTMELVDGESLAHRLRDGGAMSVGRLVGIATELCAGLDAAHQAGVLHRDLKPDNILIAGDGRVVITDFGIARAASVPDGGATGIATVVGTPAYMAPEQLEGRPDVDARADVWALGVILFELATGRRPWDGGSPVAIALAQSRAPRPDPRALRADLPAGLCAAIARCLEPDPAGRYRGAAELAAELTVAAPAASPSRPWTGGELGPAARVASLAVLPFRREADDDYLAVGLVEDVIDTLSMTAGLRVRPMGAVGRLDPDGDPREAGRALEVEHVAFGSVRRTSTGLRVTTRLVHVGDGFQIWAERTDCAADAVLEVGAAIARGIAAALSARAAPRPPPTDPRVVELYLRARHELRKFWREPMERAAALLEDARRLAPDSPMVLATLAYVRVRLWAVGAQPGLAAAARAAADAAMAAAPELGESRLARGLIELNLGDVETAAGDIGYAVRRAVNLPEAHTQAALLHVELGDLDEARARFASAIAIDPGVRPHVECELARLDALAGDFAGGEARLDAVMRGDEPSLHRMASFYRARLRMWQGDVVGAARLAAVTAGNDRNGAFAMFFADLARDEQFDEASWRTWFERMTIEGAALRGRLFASQVLGEAALGCGQPELGVVALGWAVDHGFKDLHWWDRCPLMRRLDDDPRIAPMRARVEAQAARIAAAYRRGVSG